MSESKSQPKASSPGATPVKDGGREPDGSKTEHPAKTPEGEPIEQDLHDIEGNPITEGQKEPPGWSPRVMDEKAGIPIPGVPDTSEPEDPEVDPAVIGDGDEVDEEAVREARDVEGVPDEETPVSDPEAPDRPD